MQNVVQNYDGPSNSCAGIPAITGNEQGTNDTSIKDKIVYLMKLSFMILILQYTFAGVLIAATASGQDLNSVKVDLNLKNAGIAESLLTLQRQSGIKISFFEQLFEKETKKVTLHTGSISVSDALKSILSNTNLRYKRFNNFVVIEAKPIPVKPGRISGRISDDRGETLPGASIKVIETGNGTQAGADGSYILNIPPGTYTLEISYMSFTTQRVTGVVVTEDKNTPLDIALKPDAKGLKVVVVTATYRKASIEGLLTRQKNAAEVSNGISADQISRTPDKNIGESLKRISGVSSIDNKFVLVRGIGERYNAVMLDGTVLPSTEAQSRSFSFDLIPSNMVDNVVVSKTVTPDMNASFGGGLIQVNTKDIPNENFTTFSAGVSYNDQATGKDLISHKRGKYDYLGFDDGRRAFPKGLISQTSTTTPEQTTEQSRRFTNDNFTVYHNNAAPSQNYQFTIGRLLALDTAGSKKFGFTGSISYRNTQSNNIIGQQRRANWEDQSINTGNAYGFNTTWGGLLNVGLQLGKSRFSFRNTYTHLYDNALVRITGDNTNLPMDEGMPPNRIQEADDPTFTDLLQNKLSGQHQLGKIKVEWDVARTSVSREEKDMVIAESRALKLGSQYEYYYVMGSIREPRIDPTSRQNYHNREQHYSWNVSATIPFNLAGIRSSIKTGYFGNQKKADFDWVIVPFTADPAKLPDSLKYLSIGEMIKPGHLGPNGFQFVVNSQDSYAGKSSNHAGFIMFDNRLLDKLRLVWGIRGEYYQYTEINNPNNINETVYSIKPDPHWQWLPSANLTYSPLSSLNVRAAYSSSVVRPELMDNSQFWRYSPYLGGQYGNQGLYSTRINSWDFKTEWFSGLGEIISVGAFYKKFDKPAELTIRMQSGNTSYYLKSSDWAKVYGLEFELRKNFGFIADSRILHNLSVYGNLTLQKAEVRATYLVKNPVAGQPDLDAPSKQSRPMYGQTPYLINAGLQYNGDHFGFNVMYNKSGIKTYLVSETPDLVEYENDREQIDAQISYRFLKKRLEIKLNAGNLLNKPSVFYRNSGSYEPNPDYTPGADGDISNAQRLKPGFTEKFEEGDQVTFSQKFGRTYSASLTWNF
ncbi:TonB-dependent receptor plug domain-containing protein [Chitinophaga sp. SYP-B3965]|uniref:TonB-dependent receptor n=1 Tax=Chitinophaga sp. SYP-B3965 TaxID=2663120 RepID=UPI00129976C7|nr:TonB-dependent receptor [Chitinophaga sp. SYP-B3965]MRG48197.1 TonB-dependent receptor plug domain-containing protein [Chitinophaga sp. SYP-B3965]